MKFYTSRIASIAFNSGFQLLLLSLFSKTSSPINQSWRRDNLQGCRWGDNNSWRISIQWLRRACTGSGPRVPQETDESEMQYRFLQVTKSQSCEFLCFYFGEITVLVVLHILLISFYINLRLIVKTLDSSKQVWKVYFVPARANTEFRFVFTILFH